ncbi:hypothetical protein NA57DRAFT_56256 [Rhizodiscina lignyota]|uniref:Pre-mRNA-splicing factor n=1 Tax=Rhizodiscina lignyota TaxID=1504668 RepID=A0A9P4IB30_9PEZI|nr:hypothetical protein NA57DRAFT_56256 [Rhizodiscina lignyota]
MSGPRFSLTLGTKKTTVPPPPTRKPALGDHDSDLEDDAEGKAHEVSHFDLAAGGAIHEKHTPKKREPLVIKAQPNRDWMEESRRKRQKTGLPGEERNGRDMPDEKNGAPKSYGLNVMEKQEVEVEHIAAETKDEKKTMTDDERALAALLGEKAKSDLVLPNVETEEEVFNRDYREAPDVPTLADYAAVPVEEFGAALLRGMGWKDGEDIGKEKGQAASKPTLIKHRPALLGIGAKQDAAVGVELGAWGKSAKGKKKVDIGYNPVMMENKKTGKQFTEEELKRKLEDQTLIRYLPEKDGAKHESDRDHDSSSKHRKHREEHGYDSRDRDRKRRERSRDYEERKHRDSRRNRSSSTDRRHRSKKDDQRGYDDRRHRSGRDRSASPDDGYRSRKDREKDRKYDKERYRSSRRD